MVPISKLICLKKCFPFESPTLAHLSLNLSETFCLCRNPQQSLWRFFVEKRDHHTVPDQQWAFWSINSLFAIFPAIGQLLGDSRHCMECWQLRPWTKGKPCQNDCSGIVLRLLPRASSLFTFEVAWEPHGLVAHLLIIYHLLFQDKVSYLLTLNSNYYTCCCLLLLLCLKPLIVPLLANFYHYIALYVAQTVHYFASLDIRLPLFSK